MEIRTAIPSDAEELIELSQSSILKTCREDYTQPQLKAWANGINRPNRFKEAIKNQYFIVAEIDNEIVGFASLENGNYIDFLYVLNFFSTHTSQQFFLFSTHTLFSLVIRD